MKKYSIFVIQALFFTIALVGLAGILANSVSNVLTSSNPHMASSINPFNHKATVNLIKELAQSESLEKQISAVKRGLYYEPYNAELYGLYGNLKEGANVKQARILYNHSLRLDPTNRRSLLHSFVLDANTGDLTEAFKKAELIFRAWPKSASLIEPYFAQLLSNVKVYELARKRLSNLSGHRKRQFINALRITDNGKLIARSLLLDWHSDGVKNIRTPINDLTYNLIADGKINEASSLFVLTLNLEEKPEAGLNYNHNFAAPLNGNRFDWALPKVRGVDFSIVSNNRFGSESEGSENNALQIKLLGSPVKMNAALQFTKLNSADFVWSVTYSTVSLKAPKEINLHLRCQNQNKLLGTISLSETSNAQKTISIPVNVTPGDCPIQMIMIETDVGVESWKDLYSGRILIDSISFKHARNLTN